MTTIKLGNSTVDVTKIDIGMFMREIEDGLHPIPREDTLIIRDMDARSSVHLLTYNCTAPGWTRIKEKPPGAYVDAKDQLRVGQVLSVLALDDKGRPSRDLTTKLLNLFATKHGFSDGLAMDAWMNKNYGEFVVPVPKDALLGKVGKDKSFALNARIQFLMLNVHRPLLKSSAIYIAIPFAVEFSAKPFFDCKKKVKLRPDTAAVQADTITHLKPAEPSLKPLLLEEVESRVQIESMSVLTLKAKIKVLQDQLREDPDNADLRNELEEAFKKAREHKARQDSWKKREDELTPE